MTGQWQNSRTRKIQNNSFNTSKKASHNRWLAASLHGVGLAVK